MKKILIIRFSSIGDIVLTTPVVRCLKQQLGAEIHFLTKQSFQAVVAANPHIDRLYTIKKKVSEVLPQLKAEKYDYIIDLHKNLRTLLVKLQVPGKSYAFNKLNWEKWLMVRLKINRLPPTHIVDRYLATAAPLGITNDGQGLDYFIPKEEEVNLEENTKTQNPTSILQLRTAFKKHKAYIAFVIGAAHNTKRLPIDKMIALCRNINMPIVLLGGPDETEEGTQIARESGPHVINSCGQLKLNQSASLVRQAHKVISHDTGLMHIAAAFRKEIITIWGNTIPEFGMYPYLPQDEKGSLFEVKNLDCRPCSKIGYQTCPKGHFRCMRDLEDGAIVAAVTQSDNKVS
ncbi:MAG: glycosyl hydrolase [Saprospiraceae bacterium]|nr:MAG: glycosyl hydrolase [Saprospiraceae bacterium]